MPATPSFPRILFRLATESFEARLALFPVFGKLAYRSIGLFEPPRRQECQEEPCTHF
jgi:hypothetical protein